MAFLRGLRHLQRAAHVGLPQMRYNTSGLLLAYKHPTTQRLSLRSGYGITASRLHSTTDKKDYGFPTRFRPSWEMHSVACHINLPSDKSKEEYEKQSRDIEQYLSELLRQHFDNEHDAEGSLAEETANRGKYEGLQLELYYQPPWESVGLGVTGKPIRASALGVVLFKWPVHVPIPHAQSRAESGERLIKSCLSEDLQTES